MILKILAFIIYFLASVNGNHNVSESRGSHAFAEGGLVNVNLTQQKQSNPFLLSVVANYTHEDKIANGTSNETSNDNIKSTTVKNLKLVEEPILNTTITRSNHTEHNTSNNASLKNSPSEVSNVKPRKGVEYPKIFARKGVNSLSVEDTSNSLSIEDTAKRINTLKTSNLEDCSCSSVPANNICLDCSTCLKDLARNNVTGSCNACKTNNCTNYCCDIRSKNSHSLSDIFLLDLKKQMNISNKTFIPVVEFPIETDFSSSKSPSVSTVKFSTSVPFIKKKKPVITVTADEVKMINTKSTPNNSVIPFIVTLFAVPLVAILLLCMYNKTKEYWEKRHYRRMDFLIDGIYND